jgi:hypothetical protein
MKNIGVLLSLFSIIASCDDIETERLTYGENVSDSTFFEACRALRGISAAKIGESHDKIAAGIEDLRKKITFKTDYYGNITVKGTWTDDHIREAETHLSKGSDFKHYTSSIDLILSADLHIKLGLYFFQDTLYKITVDESHIDKVVKLFIEKYGEGKGARYWHRRSRTNEDGRTITVKHVDGWENRRWENGDVIAEYGSKWVYDTDEQGESTGGTDKSFTIKSKRAPVEKIQEAINEAYKVLNEEYRQRRESEKKEREAFLESI